MYFKLEVLTLVSLHVSVIRCGPQKDIPSGHSTKQLYTAVPAGT
jgi:hypothetical protein